MEPEPGRAPELELERLRAAVTGAVREPDWLAAALARLPAEPDAIGRLFPAAGRRCGRGELPGAPAWSVDDAARALLLAALPGTGPELAGQVAQLYRYGDAAERRAVLRALPWLPVGDAAVPLLVDAIRTNDPRLLAAALGRYAVHLDHPSWRQAVLKCVFLGVPLAVVHDLTDRADATLAGMLADLAAERRAAGRDLPADAVALLHRLTDLQEG
jgi:hypothetical protein